MKKCALFSAIFILFIVVLGIVFCVFALKITEKLIKSTSSLPNSRQFIQDSQISSISQCWDKSKKYLALLVKNDYLTNAELALHTLVECSKCGTDAEYLCAKEAFLVSLEAISSSCEISFASFL